MKRDAQHYFGSMAYVPPSRRKKRDDPLRDARSILNKLTREKFDSPVTMTYTVVFHTHTHARTHARARELRAAYSLLSVLWYHGRLSDKMADIKINSVLLLKKLIDCVFDKALLEPSFGDLYAELCKKVSERESPFPFIEVEEDADKGGWCWRAKRTTGAGGGNADGAVAGSLEDEICCRPHGPYRSREDASKSAMSRAGFKRFLLNKCQEEFEKEAR